MLFPDRESSCAALPHCRSLEGIGRDPAAAHITIEDESVSRAHMHLQLNESGLVASDLQSTNGSAINGEPLTAYNSCSPVEDGDTLTLGYITLQVEFI